MTLGAQAWSISATVIHVVIDRAVGDVKATASDAGGISRDNGGAKIAMRRGGALSRWLGMRLALAALLVQAAIPFLLAFEIRAAIAQSAEDAVIAQSLCIHDGGGSAGGSSHSDCNIAFCPLCSTLAVASSLAPPAAEMPGARPLAWVVSFSFDLTQPFARPAFPQLYRSRAPPLA